MDDAVLVGHLECPGRLGDDPERDPEQKSALLVEEGFEVGAVHELHDDEIGAILGIDPGVVDRDDVRVVEGGRAACLLSEARDELGIGGERAAQELDRDVTFEDEA